MQATASTWSYTKYDELARVVESGEISGYGSPLTNDVNDRNFPYDGGAYPKEFVTKTTYTQPCTIWLPDYGVFSQEHLQNRISYTITDRDANAGTTDDRVVSIYSYDPHGNVKSLVQYIGNAASAVCMDYQYDVVSNKVIKMNQRKLFLPVYQPGWLQEDFTQHRYSYDGDKRLVYYWDGFDNSGWLQRNAAYQYYLHGPLRRVELAPGLNFLQGVDYTYTLQGWLKAINNSKLTPATDPGMDAPQKDLFGMVLHYYEGDYNRTGSPLNNLVAGNTPLVSTDTIGLGGGNLYNGNISRWQTNVAPIVGWTPPTLPQYERETGNSYRYDQLNRITKSRFWDHHPSLGWGRHIGGPYEPYDEGFTYDKNGNITRAWRSALDGTLGLTLQDNMGYGYTTANNQLGAVTDGSGATTLGDAGNTFFNYDAIGQLTTENAIAEGYTLQMKWTPYGKVSSVTRTAGSATEWRDYLYDGMGNQVCDRKYDGSGSLLEEKYYIYDANNTKLATYHTNMSGVSTPDHNDMWVDERYLYGSERVATIQGANVTMAGIVMYPAWDKVYELHDHLGNVRATFNWWHPAVIPPTIPVAYTSSYHHMYAFGAPQPNRYYESLSAYHWGFNGQERKDDWRVLGGTEEFRFRDHDSRIGRFSSVDPVAKDYPWNSPYAFAENRPIDGIDLEGKEFVSSVDKYQYTGGGGDYIKVLPNVAVDLFNGLIGLWNSGVTAAKSISQGSFVKDIKNEVKEDVEQIKGYVNEQIDYATSTPFTTQLKDAVSPRAIEGMLEVAGTIATSKVVESLPKMNVGVSAASESKGLPPVSSAAKGTAAVEKNGSTVANRTGQQMHKAYKVGENGIKEFRLPSGNRIDFLDIENGTIFELKPNNARAIKQGHKQLNMYKKELESMPKFKGIPWKMQLDTY